MLRQWLETATSNNTSWILENDDAGRIVITAGHDEGSASVSFYSHNISCPRLTVWHVLWTRRRPTKRRSNRPVEASYKMEADVEKEFAQHSDKSASYTNVDSDRCR
jgi:hypothetical protein